jgi:3-hydroxyisobutyrate dehydrogenase-like beta-hydroxyacid dehydrogenase
MSAAAKTVGILYPGEMGAALARVLTRRGVRCVTFIDGRSDETARRCREESIAALDAFADVIRESDVVLSVVRPSAAEGIADLYCRHAELVPAGAVFVDVNSTSPELAAALAAKMEATGIGFVDAAVNGLAVNLTTTATLFLSGERAAEVAALFGETVVTRLLGAEAGCASAMKMLLAGISKGTCALFLELAVLAESRGMLAEMIEATGRIYPGVRQLVDRMLPTYAAHAARRADEMRELESTASANDLRPPVIEGVRQLHELLAAVTFGEPAGADEPREWSVPALVRHVRNAGSLAACDSAVEASR